MDVVQKKNALVVPQTLHKDFGGGVASFAHGVVRGPDDPVYFSHMRHGKPLLNGALQAGLLSKPATKLAGKWLYLGGLYNHFGHFLAECIHRVWAWKIYRGQCSGVLFLPNIKQFESNRHFPGYAKDVLSLLGLEETDIRYITGLTEVEELVIPEPGVQLCVPASDDYLKFLATLQLGDALVNVALPEGFSPKVLVSRKNYRMFGSIAGMDGLEANLEKDGYFIFCPENYPIAIQLKVYSEAEKIIFEEGSAIHLLELFDKIKADVLQINRRQTTKLFDGVIQPRTNHYVKYSGSVMLPRLLSADANALSVTSMKKLSEFLVQHGFASPSLVIDLNWQDKVKADIFNYLLKQANSSPPEFNEKVVGYLNGVNDFLNAAE